MLVSKLNVKFLNLVDGIVDSLPPGLLEGRPAGNSFFLTSHQLQQLVATASQHQQTEQVATASGGLTLALHHTAGGGTGVLAPQLLITPQAPSFTAYPVTSGSQHTTSIQQVLQHHVRQSSILQSTIQQVGSQQTQPQSYTEANNGIISSSNKCFPVSPASPFSSRSLTPSPQQRVLTPQPVFQQVMSATGPVLQLYQPATRATSVAPTAAATAMTPQTKNKPPQQILPKPITNIVAAQTNLKSQPPQANAQTTGALLLNQMIPNTGVIVGQQTSNGVQLILKSPSPQTISTSVPKAQVVVSSNGSLSAPPNTVFVQANRTQPQQQLVRLITGQSLQLQQIQTSSGPALVAVPTIQSTLQPSNSTPTATVVPSVTTVPVQTSVFNQNVIKKSTNPINANCINSNQLNSVHSNSSNKKKKRKEEETMKFDLANLIKISGIDEEDVSPIPTSMSTSSSLSSSLSSISSTSSISSSPPASCTIPTQSPPITLQQQQQRLQEQTVTQIQSEQQSFHQQKNHQASLSRPSTPKQNTATPVLAQLQTPTNSSCGLRFSIAEDGHIILHQPQIASQSVTASVATAAQTQLAQLVAEHSGHILQQTAVLSLTGSESIVLKTPTGFALRQPSVLLQRASTTPNVVLTTDPNAASNGVRIITDVSGLNGLAGKVQFVSGNTMQDHNRVQIVTGVQNPSAMSLTEQQRVQIVTAAVPDLSSMSLTTEQQNHLQILTNVPNTATAEVSLTEQQQNRMEIISNVPANSGTVNETKNRIQVIPNARTVSLTEQLVSDISQQILTTNHIPNTSNIHEQNTRLIFQNTSSEQHNSDQHNSVHISASERTDVHITSNSLPESAISNQQTKLQMIATNIPQNCSISLNEQNRFHIIPSAELTLDEKSSQLANENTAKLMNSADHLQQFDQHMRIQTDTEQQHVQHQQSASQCNTHMADNQRFHVISNVGEQQQFMQVNEEQNRIIVSSSIEHQRVLNASAVSFNEQRERVQLVSGNADQQRLLQQLSEEQRKIQIFTSVPQQQRIMQLNEQQSKLTVTGLDSFQEQLQQSMHQQSPQRLTGSQQQPLHKLTVQVKDGDVQHKLTNSSSSTVIDSKYANESSNKLPDSLNNSEPQVRNADLISVQEETANRLNQNLLHNRGVILDSTLKTRTNTFDGRNSTINSVMNSPHQTSSTSPYSKTSQRNNVNCSSSSVISPRCTPSPHSPHFNNKSPSSSTPSSQHHSPQSPVPLSQNLISTCFSNRPNLTVVTQSSPPSSTVNQNQIVIEQQQQNIAVASTSVSTCPSHIQIKPCATVISHPNVSHTNNNYHLSNIITSTSQNNNTITVLSAAVDPGIGIISGNVDNGCIKLNAATNFSNGCQTDLIHSCNDDRSVSTSVTLTSAATSTPLTTTSMALPSLTCPTSVMNVQTLSPELQQQNLSMRIVPQSTSPSVINQNSFLESIAQSHPNLSINKTGIVQPCSKSNVMRGKKPKKSAVVKPMVFQSEDKDKIIDGPACLNPVSSNDGSHSSVVQRVQTIQLTPQKQQSLKVVQSQIAVLSAKKTRTPMEQSALQKLFNEQQKILLSGKIIPTVPGQNTQGLTFVSTPVRLVPPPSTPPSPHAPSTPPTCNKATSPLHVQVGTQTTLDEPVSTPVAAPPLPTSSSPVRAQTLSPPPLLSPVPKKPVLPKLTPAKRAALITEQLEIDQRGVANPDTTTPFSSISDACKRLLRYHCLDEPVLGEKDLEKADEIFEATAKHLLDKNNQMLNKYSYLLCRESMREVQTSELIMLGRMFVADETQLLDKMKQELLSNNNPPNTCSIATQVDASSPASSVTDDVNVSSSSSSSIDAETCPPQLCHFNEFISEPPTSQSTEIVTKCKREREFDDIDSMQDNRNDVKKHCPDDEEINAQVQSAIDSILNLQRSDPATDEAVRSILPS